MESQNSDEENPASECVELVPTSGFRKLASRRSFPDSVIDTTSSTRPDAMVSIGMFANVLCSRIFHLQSSKLTDEWVAQNETFHQNFQRMGMIITYHTLLMSQILKNRLMTHSFYSKHCVKILDSNKRVTQTNDHDLKYKRKIRRMVEGICDTAVTLENVIAADKKLYSQVLMSDLEYPDFLISCRHQIEDLKSTLKEQVINRELKHRVEKEKEEIKFLGELCSRLLVVTPLTEDRLIDTFLKTKNIVNYVNDVGKLL